MGMRRDDITAYERMQIALAVLSPDRAQGMIADLAAACHLSRQSIYAIAQRAYEVLLKYLQPGAHGPPAKSSTIQVDRNRMVRGVGTLTLAGVSQRGVIDCLVEMLDTEVSLGWVNGQISELDRRQRFGMKARNQIVARVYREMRSTLTANQTC